MRKQTTSVFLGLAAILLAAQPALASRYFPNRTTDSMTYRSIRFGGELTFSVDGTSNGWVHWSNFGGLGPMWVWTSTSHERVYVYANGRSQLFADFSAARGTQWPISIPPVHDPSTVTLAQTGQVVRTPAGTFKNCITLELPPNAMDAGVGSITFAPGVGIVQIYASNIAGPIRSVFVRGTAGGVSYPRPPRSALAVSGWTDAYEYWIDGAYQASGPTTLTATITLRNRTSEPILGWFQSGQSFDIAVYDSEGNQVMIWSYNKRFTNQMRRISLGAGQALTFTGNVDLVSMTDGQPLPAGDYRVRMWLTSDLQTAVEFPVKIRVTQ